MVDRPLLNRAKNTLLSSFRRGIAQLKNGQAAASPMQLDSPAEGLRDRLAHDFDCARFGTHFRSVSFPVAAFPGESEYYKAIATSPDLKQWAVQSHRTQPYQLANTALPIDQPVTRLINVYQNLTFFRALEIVATFEATQKTSPIGMTRDDLGADHYHAFATLHQIGFDIHGIPQPTQSGHIMIPGQYPADQPDYIAPPIAEMQIEWETKASIASRGTVSAFAHNLSNLVKDQEDLRTLQRWADLARFYLDVSMAVHQSPGRQLSDEQKNNCSQSPVAIKNSPMPDWFKADFSPLRFSTFNRLYYIQDDYEGLGRDISRMLGYTDSVIGDQTEKFFRKIYLFNIMQDIKVAIATAPSEEGVKNFTLAKIQSYCNDFYEIEKALIKTNFEKSSRVEELIYQMCHEPIATEIPADLIAFCSGIEAMVVEETKKFDQKQAAVFAGALKPS